MSFERVIEALEPYRRGKHSWRCPAHDDRLPSLVVDEGVKEGHTLVYCHAGCPVEDIMDALDLPMDELFPPQEEAEGPTFEHVPPTWRRLEARYPAISFLVAQSDTDRRWYLDGGEREGWLRAQYPEVPDDIWEALRG